MLQTVPGLSGMCYYYEIKGRKYRIFINNETAQEWSKNSNWQISMIASIQKINNPGDITFLGVGSF